MADDSGIVSSPYLGGHTPSSSTASSTKALTIRYTNSFLSLARMASHAMFGERLVYHPIVQAIDDNNDDDDSILMDVDSTDTNNQSIDNITLDIDAGNDWDAQHSVYISNHLQIRQYFQLDADDKASIPAHKVIQRSQEKLRDNNAQRHMRHLTNDTGDCRVHVSTPCDRGKHHINNHHVHHGTQHLQGHGHHHCCHCIAFPPTNLIGYQQMDQHQ
jgi:hypothetical protein